MEENRLICKDMNSVVEKLAAIEKEVAAIQPKMAPLTQRIADLDQKVASFAQQLTSVAEESAAVKQDIELTQQSLTRIQTLIGESKVESEQLVAGQEENQQRCETMTAVFGAAFQAVSQFFETAQRMGLADQAKAVFLPPPSESVPSAEPVPSAESAPSVESVPSSVAAPVVQPISDESPETEDESVLSESDFDSAMSDAGDEEPNPWSVPGLPDVAAPPDMEDADSENTDFTNGEPSNVEPTTEMASQLDVPPLNLGAPDLPEQSETTPMDETDDQEIEAMLASMMAPVTATAGG